MHAPDPGLARVIGDFWALYSKWAAFWVGQENFEKTGKTRRQMTAWSGIKQPSILNI